MLLHPAQPRYKLVIAKAFSHERIGSRFVRSFDIIPARGCGNDNHWHLLELWLTAHPSYHVDASKDGHFQVNEYQCGPQVLSLICRTQIFDGLLAIAYNALRMGDACCFVCAFEKKNVVFIVVGKEYDSMTSGCRRETHNTAQTGCAD